MTPTRLLAAAVLALSAAAAPRPDLTGTWKLNGGSAGGVHDVVFEIRHKDPAVSYTASGMRGQLPFREAFEFTTDGRMPPDPAKLGVAAQWEGETLVMRYTKGGKEIARVTLRLSSGRNQIVREGQIGHAKIYETYDRQ